MALADLYKETSKNEAHDIDPSIEARLVSQVLELVTDANGDVKNMMIQVYVVFDDFFESY